MLRHDFKIVLLLIVFESYKLLMGAETLTISAHILFPSHGQGVNFSFLFFRLFICLLNQLIFFTMTLKRVFFLVTCHCSAWQAVI